MFYVGQGRKNRARTKALGRAKDWNLFAQNGWESLILYDKLTKNEAIAKEKETILNFLNELPDDCYLDVHQEQDYDDAYNYILRPYHYRSETDEEWNNRLSDLVRKVDSYLFHEEYKVKRSGIPELDKYIEYLENRR